MAKIKLFLNDFNELINMQMLIGVTPLPPYHRTYTHFHQSNRQGRESEEVGKKRKRDGNQMGLKSN